MKYVIAADPIRDTELVYYAYATDSTDADPVLAFCVDYSDDADPNGAAPSLWVNVRASQLYDFVYWLWKWCPDKRTPEQRERSNDDATR